MSSRNDEIQDPNLSDLPPEAFEPIEGSPTLPQLEARIRAKREQAQQDAGHIESPHHAADIEPIEPPAAVEPEQPEEAEPEEAVEPEAEEEDDEAPEGEEPDEQTDEEDDEDFFVGRYKTKDDAEAAMREKDQTIARLFRERYEREQQPKPPEGQQQQQEPQPAQIDPEAWHQWAAEAVEEEQGVQGAMAALEKGGPQGFDIYLAYWMASEDPVQRAEALAFNNEVTRQYAAKSAAKPTQQPVDNGEIPDDPIVAQQVVAARFPDFEELRPEMNRLMSDPEALDPPTRQWLFDLSQQGGRGKALAWDYLYRTAHATRAPRREQVVKEERQRRKVSADEAKLAATVSSSEGASTRTPLSEAELAVIRKRNGIREKAGLPLLTEE